MSFDKFMTKLSEGALISVAGRWNIRGAFSSVPEESMLVSKMFPAGSALTVIVETSMFAGFDMPELHHGVYGF